MTRRQHVATMLSWRARNTVVAGLFTGRMSFLLPNSVKALNATSYNDQP